MKRPFMILAVAAILALGAWAVLRGRWGAAPSAADGPIILISIDTLRADHLPAYGYTHVRTPNIDALASEAAVFEQAYTHSPQTLPAHTSILSGQLPFDHGVRDNIGFTVKPGQWFIQRALHERGWPTGGFVSAYVLRSATGINQGFDTFDSDLPPASPELSIGQVQRDGSQTLAAAEKWLGARDAKPFFLFLHFYEPHKPYAPPARFAPYGPYDGEIAYADELVGRLFDRLRAAKLYDRATIVLLADHGEGLGDHGEQEHGMFLYRETTHVPLMVKLPGRHPARRVAAPVQHIDLVPTILDLVGAAGASRAARPIAAPAARRHRHVARRGHLRGGALFALPLRLERAVCADRLALSADPRAARRAVRSRARPERDHLDRRRAAAGAAGDARRARVADRERVDHRPGRRQRRRQAAAHRARLRRRRQQRRAVAARRLAAGPRRTRSRSSKRYRRAADLAGSLKYDEAGRIYREVLAEDPEMTRRVAAARRGATSAAA